MAFMKWTNERSVGVAQLDSEHKQLIKIINQLYEGMSTGSAKSVLKKVFDAMVSYTDEHFGHEEQFFEQTQYPLAAEHRVQHEELKQLLARFQGRERQEGQRASRSGTVVRAQRVAGAAHHAGRQEIRRISERQGHPLAQRHTSNAMPCRPEQNCARDLGDKIGHSDERDEPAEHQCAAFKTKSLAVGQIVAQRRAQRVRNQDRRPIEDLRFAVCDMGDGNAPGR